MRVNLLQTGLVSNVWRRLSLTQSVRTRSRGFTIVELFVVISIALIIVAVALPAFSSMSYSANRSLAENSLRQGVTLARDVSVGSVHGGDGAAVFLFDPDTGRISIVAAEWVGTMTDLQDEDLSKPIERDVFAPVVAGEPIVLPRYWAVRGYAPARFANPPIGNFGIGFDWYDSTMYAFPNTWNRGHWIFPEDGFYDVNGALNVPIARGRSPRQSFMVRFNSQTGQVDRGGREALFVDARPSSENRSDMLRQHQVQASSRTDNGAELRLDWAENASTWARRILTDGNLNKNAAPYEAADEKLRRALIGNVSLDTVLVQSVSRVALYDERKLAQALGARELSRRRRTIDTSSLYSSFRNTNPPPTEIKIDFDSLFEQGSPFNNSPAGQRALVASIDRWISGDTNRNPDGTVGNGVLFESTDNPQAVRFLVDAYSGELLEVTR